MTDRDIEWGEWGECDHGRRLGDDYQFQRAGGVDQFRYPVPKQPVVETEQRLAMLLGKQICTTYTFIDGVMQPTATVEALA